LIRLDSSQIAVGVVNVLDGGVKVEPGVIEVLAEQLSGFLNEYVLVPPGGELVPPC
jgi:hypothetical protein